MSLPMHPDTLLKALAGEGCEVVEHEGWRERNRNHKGPWGEVYGVMIHHTVTSGTDASVQLCIDGHPALPGPLAHGVIDKEGRVHLIGHGRANHAGRGDSRVLAAVIEEEYKFVPPQPTRMDVDGNRHFYGFECINLGDGRDEWPHAQLDGMARASAALCQVHGWSEKSVIGHKEWTHTKIDPRGFPMFRLRAAIATRLNGWG